MRARTSHDILYISSAAENDIKDLRRLLLSLVTTVVALIPTFSDVGGEANPA